MQPYTLDIALRGRILNGCWLLAAAGTSIAQMLLLAQAWQEVQSATRTACIAGAWLAGVLLGGLLNSAQRRRFTPPACVWGVAFLVSAVVWRLSILLRPSTMIAGLAISTCQFLAMALLLGLLSSLWFGQRRSWAVVGEKVALARNVACLTFGLVIVWCCPRASDLVGLLCLLPLLSLDLITTSFNPCTSWRRMTGTLPAQQAGPVHLLSLRLERRARLTGWWRSYFVRRRYAMSALLASGTAILLGAVWGSIPTAFAGGLAATGEINKLIWLLGGQLGALALGAWLLNRSRGLVGAPGRLVPFSLQTLVWRLVWLSLAGIAVSLVLLGLPYLQRPWSLGISVGIYTLAATTCGMLLPRLRPSIATEAFAQGHLAFGQGRVMRSGYLAYQQAIENRARLVVSTGEGLMTAVCAPIVGLFIDHITGGRTLILMGLVLAWFLVAVLVANPAGIANRLFARPATVRSTSVNGTRRNLWEFC